MTDRELRKVGNKLPDAWDAAVFRRKLASHPKYAQALKHYDKSEYHFGKAARQGVAEDLEIKIPTEDGITMQDIRLMAGEGPLTKKTVLQAIAVIRKQRRPQGVAEAANEPRYPQTHVARDDIHSSLSGDLLAAKGAKLHKTPGKHAQYRNLDTNKWINLPDKNMRRAQKGVAEGLNEFAPDSFNGGNDGEEFSPEIAKMAQEDGFTKGAGLADGATLERAMTINHWHSQHGGMYKQYFAKGFKSGRMNKINHDNKQYNLNLKLMKDGSIRHGEQGVAEGLGGNWYIRVNGKILNDTKFKPVIFSSEDEARSHAMKLADKKRIPLSQMKLTKSWMDAPEQGVAEAKQRLDPKCWTGKHKEGTKMKGGVRVNNCVPNESAIMKGIKV
jgi:hypothetical protein